MDGTEALPWDVAYMAAVFPLAATAVMQLPDPDERAHLARELPAGRACAISVRTTPDAPLLVVGVELGDVGRGGYLELFAVPIGDAPGELPMSLLPEDRRADLLADVARMVADLPPVPDTVAALLD
nr:hypothetical protein [Micromonospora sp. DSM 115978]